MRTSTITTAALAAVLALALPASEAWAARKKSDSSAAASPPKKAVKTKRSKSSSEESRSESERRLRAECKGLPNAGACRGYTD